MFAGKAKGPAIMAGPGGLWCLICAWLPILSVVRKLDRLGLAGLDAEQLAHAPDNVFLDQVSAGYEDQCDAGGEEHAEAQAHRHGYQELGLQAALEDDGG